MVRRLICLWMVITLGRVADAATLQVSAWNLKPDGDIAVGSGGRDGTTMDLKDDLGFNDAELVNGFEAVLGDMHQIAVSAVQLDLSARNRVDRDFKFAGEFFHVDSLIRSDLEAQLWRVAYRFVAGSDEMRGGFLLGFQYADLDARVSSADIGRARESAQFVLPVIGGLVEYRPSTHLGFRAALTMGSWDWDDVEATFVELEMEARLRVEPFFAGLGYRHLATDSQDESVPVNVDVTLAGPTLFAGIEF